VEGPTTKLALLGMASRRSLGFTWDANGNLTSDGVRSYTYDHANRLTQVTEGSLTTQFAYNGDGVRVTKNSSGDTTQYIQDLAATLPVVISDTEAVYLYGLDIIAQQQTERDSSRLKGERRETVTPSSNPSPSRRRRPFLARSVRLGAWEGLEALTGDRPLTLRKGLKPLLQTLASS